MNLCRYCGAPLKEGARTCEYCAMPSAEGEEKIQKKKEAVPRRETGPELKMKSGQEEIQRQEEVQRQEENLREEPESGQRRKPSIKHKLWTGKLLLLFFNVILGILALVSHNTSLSAFSSILLCFCLLSPVDFD